MPRGKKTTTTAGNGGDGRTLKPDDNRAAVMEAEAVQLLSYVSHLTKANSEVDLKRAELKVKTDARTELYRLAKAAGFPRGELEDRLAELKRGVQEDHDLEVRRRRHRQILNLSDGAEQTDLPLEVLDEKRWRGEGYVAFLRGDACVIPDGCPSRFVQEWTSGWHDAETAMIFAMGKTKPVQAGTSAAPEPNPHPSAAAGYMTHELENGGWIVETRAGDELDPVHATEEEAWAAADAHLHASEVDDAIDNDDFEAKPEELGTQTDRQAVVGDREDEAV